LILVNFFTSEDEIARTCRGRRRELEAVESDERRQVEEWV